MPDTRPTAYPLQWPLGRARTTTPINTYIFRQAGNRQRHTVAQGLDFVLGELRKMGAENVIISSNLRVRLDGLPLSDQRTPRDPGVAVYFNYKGKATSFACDKWSAIEDNLWAIGLTLEAIRGQERWGASSIEASFTGYLAIAPPAPIDWPGILKLSPDATVDEIKAAYRLLAKQYHPDSGNARDPEGWHKLQAAYSAALKARGLTE